MPLELYPSIIYEGDLSPDAVGDDINEKVEGIYQACKGFGTDELRLIKVLAVLSPEDRCKVSLRYNQVHGKALKDVLKRECRGDFGQALQFLAVPPDVAECDMIKKACKGIGTDETLIYSVVGGRSNREIEILKKQFFNIYEKDLGRQLDSELSGNFEKMVFYCLQGMEEKYDPDYHTDDKVSDDVATFYKMGQGKFGTDEGGLFKIICTSPAEHLKKVNQKYADKHDVTLFKAIDDEMGGKTKDATLYLLGLKIKPYETVAKLIQKACKGIGTNELLLTCTIIRFQPHLPHVMAAYKELTGKTLQETLNKEIGGDYRRLLTELVDANSS
ncbi:annexin [Nitzschia inconspicua]|uniref:Annexin n=1 Tax=Nitzschia inconspicua TaxID=303405 RepID=A0A9K3M6V7_9STRA|nr:annexin [Nitzschia inconspicua]